jgi:RHS repeat-associated protein
MLPWRLVSCVHIRDRHDKAARARWMRRRAGRRVKRVLAAALAPMVATAQLAVPVAVTASVAAVATAAVTVAHPAKAQAATGTVLILSTSVNGGSSSAEAQDVPSGYTVTVATPSTWDAMTTVQFASYSAIVIGDPSTSSSCASSVPSDALSTAATWGAAVTGNVAVIGTAPVFAGGSGTALIKDALTYAVSGSGTGLYVSLNCEYATASAATSVPLLAHVDGGGFAVTGQGSSCPASGTVNTWAAEASPSFAALAGGPIGPWVSPACAVEETMNSWPAQFTGLAYDAGVTPATFTASDGATGQPYVVVGAPVSTATQALAPSTGGEIPAGATAGGSNPAAPGVSAATTTTADPVNPENGDFTQSATDVSVPGFGPSLSFDRGYDAQVAQQQTIAGTPGAMGYGWTENWASSLASGRPVPGDIYTMDGTRAANGNGGPPAQVPMDQPGIVYSFNGDTYIADTQENRVLEIPGTSKTQFGVTMTAGNIYTLAGSPSGVGGASGNGTPAASTLLSQPGGVAVTAAGDLVISDSGNCRVVEIAAASGTQWGSISMTAGDMYVIAGRTGGCAVGGDNKAATSSDLNGPGGISMYGGDLYIADTLNNRVQMVAGASGEAEWGISSTTVGFVYTVAGSSAGTLGASGNGGAATSALLDGPEGVKVSGNGLYIADTDNCQIREVAKSTGTQWGSISMTKNDIYGIAGRITQCTIGGDNKASTSSNLKYPAGVDVAGGGQLYIADTSNNRVQEVAATAHTEWGQSMTVGFVYTIAGSSSGAAGFSGDGGAATSALLQGPFATALDGSGNLLVADTGNNRVRQVSASTAKISALAGSGFTLGQAGNGGPANAAGLENPDGVGADAQGDVYIADTGNGRIEEIAASNHTQWGISMTAGDVYTIAGSATGVTGTDGDGGPATSALLFDPFSVATDAAGDLYIADAGNNRIQEVAATTHTQWGISMTAGDIYTVAGNASGNSGVTGDGGAATAALLFFPWGIAVDGAGDLYIADQDNNRIQEVPATGGTHWGVSMTAGDMYTVAGSASGTSGIGGDGGLATSGLLSGPTGVAVDASGNLYFTDSTNNRIQEEAATTGRQRGQSMTASHMYTIAGSATGSSGISGDGGPATSALLFQPGSLAVDASGNLYVADSFNNRIQEVAAANGTQWGTAMTANDVYTVAGSATGSTGITGDGGPAASALLDFTAGLSVDPAGNLYLTDNNNNRVREVTSTSGGVFDESPTPGGVMVTQPGGAQVTFYPQSGGNCTAPYIKAGGYCTLPQDTATLTYNSGPGTYTFVPGPGETDTFNQAGQFISQADAAGNTLTISYNTPASGSGNCPASAWQCNTVTAASGRALVLGLNTAGLVTSVTDPMGRRWLYGYSGGDLTSVTDPMSNVTSYTYGAGSTGNPQLANDLLTMTKPNAQPGGPDAGDATVNVYDSSGRVTSQTDPMGFKTTFDYSGINASTGNGTVRVTDPDGNATVYAYSQAALTAQSAWTGSTLNSEQDFGPALAAGGTSGGTLLNAWTADGNAKITTYSYDSAGNTTSATDPQGAQTTGWSTALDEPRCDGTAQAANACSASQTGPAPVAPGGVITPPSSAPPAGVTYTLYDTNGSQLWTDTGVYQPGVSTASYQQVSYTLYRGNSVTLNGSTITCTTVPPSVSLPCATINPDGVVTQLGYDSAGDLTSSATPDGNGSEIAKTTSSYDGDGEKTSTTSPDGNLSGANAGNYTTVAVYNNDGEQTSVTKAGGSGATVTPRTTNYGYDGDGNQTSVQDARGYSTVTTYNADDQASVVTNPNGNATLTCYDGDGNTTETVPPSGVAANNLTMASCPAAYPSGYGTRLASDATTWTLDSSGNNTAMTTPAPAGQSGPETTTYTYDGDGNPIKTTAPPASNANGAPNQVIADTYNAVGELASETTGYGTSAASTTSYCYDPNGDRTSVVPPDGNTSGIAPCETSSPWVVSASANPTQAGYQTTSSYDSAGELVSATAPATLAAPNGPTTTSTYDANGNKLTSTDPNGVTTTWTYTPTGRIATISYSGSSAHSVTDTYDANGQKTAMTDASGQSSYSYDPFGELTSDTNGANQAVGYGYDADGDTSSITYPLPASASWATTSIVSYGYNHSDVLNSATDFNGHQITIANNADSKPTSAVLGTTGDTITTSYDNTDRPSAISLANSGGTLQSFTYSDAPSGNILSETDIPSSPQSPATYTYDPQGRVTSMVPGTGTALSYTFDASGDLTTLPGGATGSYDHYSELTSSVQSGATTSYAYNADGQRLNATKGGTTLSSGNWNGAGQLTAYSDSAANMTAATYDGNGLRSSVTATPAGGSATSQSFVWNSVPGSAQAPQLLMDSGSAYVYTGRSTPAEQVNLSSGSITYLMSDSLGSVRGTVSSSGSLTGTTSYDAWGRPLTSGGLTASTPFGYAGYYTDPTGLLYLVNRYYDPASGQFLSVDPAVSETGQPYQYANDDPTTVTDPSGMCPYISSNPRETRCRTDKLLWRWNTILRTFQHYRDLICGHPQAPCTGHGNSHGRWLNWSSDGCSGPLTPQNPDGFPFWKACERHDFGRRNYKEQGRCGLGNKLKIDYNFYWDMKGAICNHENILVRWICNSDVRLYYGVVLVSPC